METAYVVVALPTVIVSVSFGVDVELSKPETLLAAIGSVLVLPSLYVPVTTKPVRSNESPTK